MGEDRLIVLVSMPAPDWKEHLGEPTAGPDGEVRYESADNYRIFHTRIDVWDLSDAAILVSRFEPAFIYRVIDDAHLAGYRQDDDGNPFVDIWRFRFDDGR